MNVFKRMVKPLTKKNGRPTDVGTLQIKTLGGTIDEETSQRDGESIYGLPNANKDKLKSKTLPSPVTTVNPTKPITVKNVDKYDPFKKDSASSKTGGFLEQTGAAMQDFGKAISAPSPESDNFLNTRQSASIDYKPETAGQAKFDTPDFGYTPYQLPELAPQIPFGGFMAKGGRVRRGYQYAVNDDEVFIPDQDGTVVPLDESNPNVYTNRDQSIGSKVRNKLNKLSDRINNLDFDSYISETSSISNRNRVTPTNNAYYGNEQEIGADKRTPGTITHSPGTIAPSLTKDIKKVPDYLSSLTPEERSRVAAGIRIPTGSAPTSNQPYTAADDITISERGQVSPGLANDTQSTPIESPLDKQIREAMEEKSALIKRGEPHVRKRDSFLNYLFQGAGKFAELYSGRGNSGPVRPLGQIRYENELGRVNQKIEPLIQQKQIQIAQQEANAKLQTEAFRAMKAKFEAIQSQNPHFYEQIKQLGYVTPELAQRAKELGLGEIPVGDARKFIYKESNGQIYGTPEQGAPRFAPVNIPRDRESELDRQNRIDVANIEAGSYNKNEQARYETEVSNRDARSEAMANTGNDTLNRSRALTSEAVSLESQAAKISESDPQEALRLQREARDKRDKAASLELEGWKLLRDAKALGQPDPAKTKGQQPSSRTLNTEEINILAKQRNQTPAQIIEEAKKRGFTIIN